MAKSKETYSKKEKEKTKLKKSREKEMKKEQRKANATTGKTFEDMIAYVDENGNFSSTPPDPNKRKKINKEDIEIGVPKREKVEAVRKGKVNFFNEEKGYGFIIDQATSESIFVHANGLIDPIKVNDRVTFEVERGQKGLNAIYVKVVA